MQQSAPLPLLIRLRKTIAQNLKPDCVQTLVQHLFDRHLSEEEVKSELGASMRQVQLNQSSHSVALDHMHKVLAILFTDRHQVVLWAVVQWLQHYRKGVVEPYILQLTPAHMPAPITRRPLLIQLREAMARDPECVQELAARLHQLLPDSHLKTNLGLALRQVLISVTDRATATTEMFKVLAILVIDRHQAMLWELVKFLQQRNYVQAEITQLTWADMPPPLGS